MLTAQAAIPAPHKHDGYSNLAQQLLSLREDTPDSWLSNSSAKTDGNGNQPWPCTGLGSSCKVPEQAQGHWRAISNDASTSDPVPLPNDWPAFDMHRSELVPNRGPVQPSYLQDVPPVPSLLGVPSTIPLPTSYNDSQSQPTSSLQGFVYDALEQLLHSHTSGAELRNNLELLQSQLQGQTGTVVLPQLAEPPNLRGIGALEAGQLGRLVRQGSGQLGGLVRQDSGPKGGLSRQNSGQLGCLARQDSGQLGALVRQDSGHSADLLDNRSAATRSHSETERRRRERINFHLSTLRQLLPHSAKTDKASLLGEVIDYVRELKRQAAELAESQPLPSDCDELNVVLVKDSGEGGESTGRQVIRATLCCEDKPDLLPGIMAALNNLKMKTVKAEMVTLGGRVRNVLFLTPTDLGACLDEELCLEVQKELRASLSNVDTRILGGDDDKAGTSKRAKLGNGSRSDTSSPGTS